MNTINSMKGIILCMLLYFVVATSAGAQSFTAKYDKITQDNLAEYMADWEAWSDSLWAESVKVNVDSIVKLHNRLFVHQIDEEKKENLQMIEDLRTGKIILEDDSLREDAVLIEEMVADLENYAPLMYKYITLPFEVEVSFYSDSLNVTKSDEIWGNEIRGEYDKEKERKPYKVMTIRPRIDIEGKKCLYGDSIVCRQLEHFLGGLRIGDGWRNFSEINSENEDLLSQYIYVKYAHWGGGWEFLSPPKIDSIEYYLDGFKFMRSNWSSGTRYFVPYSNPDEYIVLDSWRM